jgi:hypothetical protein
LLLGLVEVDHAMANQVLRDLGVDLDRLGRSIRDAVG